MRTVQGAELLTHGLFNDLIEEVAIADRTVEELAEVVDPSVFGIRTFRRVEGQVVFDGDSVIVASEKFKRSGIIYIDGEVMTPDEIRSSFPSNRVLIFDIERHGWDSIIKTRAGGFRPFRKGDRNITIPKGRQT